MSGVVVKELKKKEMKAVDGKEVGHSKMFVAVASNEEMENLQGICT